MDYAELFGQRLKALQQNLGPSDDKVQTSPLPLYMGGFADILTFRQYVSGITLVTSGLTPYEEQKANRLGHYELMICCRREAPWAADLISKLARYTCDAVLNPGETMDIGPAMPPKSSIQALLFAEPDVPQPQFTVAGKRCGLLLCFGITADELRACRAGRTAEVLAQAKATGVFPFTDPNRQSLKL